MQKNTIIECIVIIVYSAVLFTAGYVTAERKNNNPELVSGYQLRIDEYRKSLDIQSEQDKRIRAIVAEIGKGTTDAIGTIQYVRQRLAELENAIRQITELVEDPDGDNTGVAADSGGGNATTDESVSGFP